MLVRIVIGLLSVALLVLGFLNFGSAIDGAPAFDLDARIEGVDGEWRVQYGPAHYNQAEYLKRLGEGYLRADILVSDTAGSETEIASDEVAMARAQRAEELLLDSLRLLPSNAHTWASLAWAYAMQDRMDASRKAMENSWRLAPYNIALAYDRLGYVEFLAQTVLENGQADMSDAEREGARHDLATVLTYDPKMAATITESSPLILELGSENG